MSVLISLNLSGEDDMVEVHTFNVSNRRKLPKFEVC